MGLSPQHHGELNSHRCPKYRYDELRRQYAGDMQALQQIDAYDPSTEYYAMITKYRDALLQCNEAIISECEQWFQTHYNLL